MTEQTEKQTAPNKARWAVAAAVVLAVAVGAYFIVGPNKNSENGTIMNGVGSAEAASQQATAPTAIREGDPVVAVVNGEDITRSEVFQMISSLPPQLQQIPVDQLFPMALDNVVNNKIVLDKSGKAGLDSDADVQNLMNEAKAQIVRNVFIERQVTEKVDQRALLKKYDELLARIGDVQEVKARHILLDSEEKAVDAIKKLDGGADFATLTKELWEGAEEQNGGQLDYFAKGEVVPEFSDAAFALAPGKYTAKPVQTQFGWHVILTEDKRKRAQPDFEAVKPQLEQELRGEILNGLLEKWQKDAKVKKFDINGDPVKSN